MDGDQMFALAQALAEAKSRQDVPAAMELLHEDMVLEAPAFGTVAQGATENEQVLSAFFTSFPDYHVVLDDHANNEATLICWGTAHMTMTGERFGVTPNGRRAELPVFIKFAFKDGLIARERFFFDLSALCAQSGVSTDAVRRKLFDDADTRIRPVADIKTTHLLDIAVDLDPRRDFGSGPLGRRVLFGAAGGSFEGVKLRGEVLPGGGDWALFRADGTMTLDVRLTLKTDDGALIHMTYGGRRVTADYFRTSPLFETGAEPYAWLNDIVCIGSGYLIEGGVAYRVFEVQ